MSRLREAAQRLAFHSPLTIRSLVLNGYGWLLAHRRYGGRFAEFLADLQESQFWPLEQLRAYQLDRLRRILRSAAADVPYYRQMFRERGLHADDFQTLDDLRRLPVLTKDDIRRYYRELIHPGYPRGKTLRDSSSGTSGCKLAFVLPRDLAYHLNTAILWRGYSWSGVAFLARRATLGARMFTQRPPYWNFNRAENQLLLSIHHLDEHTADDYLQRLADFAPALLQGHPSGIHYLARHMLARRARRVPLKAIWTTGETLEEQQRREIEEAFGTPVFESYGLGESVIAAQQCEAQAGFHEISELGILEFERDPATGLYGVIGTSLWNDAMPFIRYRIDDLVELAPQATCRCGKGLPLAVQRIVGRVDDIVRTADGREVLPVTIRTVVKPHLHLHESYQLQQTGRGKYTFLFIGDVEDDRRRRVQRDLVSVLGSTAVVRFEATDRILSEGGKIRTVVNRCSHADGQTMIEPQPGER